MPYATSITMYKRRNHTVRIVVDLTTLSSISGAILTMTVCKSKVTDPPGTVVITKTNASPGGSATQAAVVSANTVEFYLLPADTSALAAGSYTADARIQTGAGVFQLLVPTALTLLEPLSP